MDAQQPMTEALTPWDPAQSVELGAEELPDVLTLPAKLEDIEDLTPPQLNALAHAIQAFMDRNGYKKVRKDFDLLQLRYLFTFWRRSPTNDRNRTPLPAMPGSLR